MTLEDGLTGAKLADVNFGNIAILSDTNHEGKSIGGFVSGINASTLKFTYENPLVDNSNYIKDRKGVFSGDRSFYLKNFNDYRSVEVPELEEMIDGRLTGVDVGDFVLIAGAENGRSLCGFVRGLGVGTVLLSHYHPYSDEKTWGEDVWIRDTASWDWSRGDKTYKLKGYTEFVVLEKSVQAEE